MRLVRMYMKRAGGDACPTMGKRVDARAFTLIELLIVVAIIAILAAIALPNFLEAQTRAKVSRVKNDLRTMATALEAYVVDNNHYPPDANRPPEYEGLHHLTTPVAYVTMDFKDPFNNQRIDGRTKFKYPMMDFDCRYELGTGSWSLGPYGVGPASMWAIASYRPDREDDTYDLGPYPFTGSACPYDATNGSTSSGDLYRLGPDNHPNFVCDYNPLVFPIAPPAQSKN